jgi:hypothetical protein
MRCQVNRPVVRGDCHRQETAGYWARCREMDCFLQCLELADCHPVRYSVGYRGPFARDDYRRQKVVMTAGYWVARCQETDCFLRCLGLAGCHPVRYLVGYQGPFARDDYRGQESAMTAGYSAACPETDYFPRGLGLGCRQVRCLAGYRGLAYYQRVGYPGQFRGLDCHYQNRA